MMRNILFLSSLLAALIWLFCYVLIKAPAAVHIVLVAGFLGIIASLCMKDKMQISK